MKTVLVIALVVLGCSALPKQADRRFPDDFLFGAATASYQVEGAADEDGKGQNIWETIMSKTPEFIIDYSNGSIAADSYHNYKRDVEIMRELGLDAYRFSVAWTRILPNGFSNYVNQAGIDYYNNFIDEMLKYNITPLLTIYHWDLPQKLQDLGGFANPLFKDWYEDYARIVFANFGDRVKHFITFNEPREICYEGYGATTKAPAVNATGVGEYICAKNLLMAHANAYHMYNREFKPTQGGQCGITISVTWISPLTDSEEDRFATELKRQTEYGIYTEPIFSQEGGFPEEIVQRVAEKSRQQGFRRTRLPQLNEEEKAFIRGAYDFLGVNHYSAMLISATEHKRPHDVPSMLDDIDVGQYTSPEWAAAASYWLQLVPNSISNAVTLLTEKYGPVPIYITENGWSSNDPGPMIDDDRIAYLRAALDSVLNAIDNGVNFRGYMAWSMIDTFEWAEGYWEHFGYYNVDFNDPARTRTPRKSAIVYKHIIKNRAIDYSYDPQDLTISIDEGH